MKAEFTEHAPGRALSKWCDIHCRVPCREELSPPPIQADALGPVASTAGMKVRGCMWPLALQHYHLWQSQGRPQAYAHTGSHRTSPWQDRKETFLEMDPPEKPQGPTPPPLAQQWLFPWEDLPPIQAYILPFLCSHAWAAGQP